MKNIFILIFASGVLSACSSIRIDTPVAQVIPSENVAEKDLELGFRAEPMREHTVTSDASARPPTFDDNNIGSANLLSSLSYGLNDQLQISGGMIGAFAGLQGQVRYQFMGTPRNQGQVGWSGAVHAEGYALQSKNSGDQNGTFGPGGYNWKGSANMTSGGAGASFGYRWDKSWMAFVGTTYNVFEIKTLIDQDQTADGTNLGGQYKHANNGDSTATGVGIVMGGGAARLIPAVQWVEYKIDRQHERGFWWSLTLEFGGSK